MTLKGLVPPLELCKRIPTGEFGDSALVLCEGYCYDTPQKLECGLMSRSDYENRCEDIATTIACYPAPTLAEIMAQLPLGTVVFMDVPDVWVAISGKGIAVMIKKAGTAETVALQMWMKLKGIEE